MPGSVRSTQPCDRVQQRGARGRRVADDALGELQAVPVRPDHLADPLQHGRLLHPRRDTAVHVQARSLGDHVHRVGRVDHRGRERHPQHRLHLRRVVGRPLAPARRAPPPGRRRGRARRAPPRAGGVTSQPGRRSASASSSGPSFSRALSATIGRDAWPATPSVVSVKRKTPFSPTGHAVEALVAHAEPLAPALVEEVVAAAQVGALGREPVGAGPVHLLVGDRDHEQVPRARGASPRGRASRPPPPRRRSETSCRARRGPTRSRRRGRPTTDRGASRPDRRRTVSTCESSPSTGPSALPRSRATRLGRSGSGPTSDDLEAGALEQAGEVLLSGALVAGRVDGVHPHQLAGGPPPPRSSEPSVIAPAFLTMARMTTASAATSARFAPPSAPPSFGPDDDGWDARPPSLEPGRRPAPRRGRVRRRRRTTWPPS